MLHHVEITVRNTCTPRPANPKLASVTNPIRCAAPTKRTGKPEESTAETPRCTKKWASNTTWSWRGSVWKIGLSGTSLKEPHWPQSWICLGWGTLNALNALNRASKTRLKPSIHIMHEDLAWFKHISHITILDKRGFVRSSMMTQIEPGSQWNSFYALKFERC